MSWKQIVAGISTTFWKEYLMKNMVWLQSKSKLFLKQFYAESKEGLAHSISLEHIRLHQIKVIFKGWQSKLATLKAIGFTNSLGY